MKILKFFFFFKFFEKKISGFSLLRQETLDMGLFIYLMWSPNCEDLKKHMWEGIFGVLEIPPLLGVLGAWITFKKAEMAKTLKSGLSMIETNPLNHNWSHFVILSGFTLHQFQKKLLLRECKKCILFEWTVL